MTDTDNGIREEIAVEELANVLNTMAKDRISVEVTETRDKDRVRVDVQCEDGGITGIYLCAKGISAVLNNICTDKERRKEIVEDILQMLREDMLDE